MVGVVRDEKDSNRTIVGRENAHNGQRKAFVAFVAFVALHLQLSLSLQLCVSGICSSAALHPLPSRKPDRFRFVSPQTPCSVQWRPQICCLGFYRSKQGDIGGPLRCR